MGTVITFTFLIWVIAGYNLITMNVLSCYLLTRNILANIFSVFCKEVDRGETLVLRLAYKINICMESQTKQASNKIINLLWNWTRSPSHVSHPATNIYFSGDHQRHEDPQSTPWCSHWITWKTKNISAQRMVCKLRPTVIANIFCKIKPNLTSLYQNFSFGFNCDLVLMTLALAVGWQIVTVWRENIKSQLNYHQINISLHLSAGGN